MKKPKKLIKKKVVQYLATKDLPDPPKPEEVFQLDMEIPLRGPGYGAPIVGWGWADARWQGTEEMCRSIGEDWKRNGCGGRILRLDGTPEGTLVEQWASIGRLEWAAEEERVSKYLGQHAVPTLE